MKTTLTPLEKLAREKDITRVREVITNQIRAKDNFTSDNVRIVFSRNWGLATEECLIDPTLISRQLTNFVEMGYIQDAHIDSWTESYFGHKRKISTWKPTELGLARVC